MSTRNMSETTIRVVCAWCGVEVRGGGKGPITHGICSRCRAEFEEACRELLARPLP
jgi:hypothetical protein